MAGLTPFGQQFQAFTQSVTASSRLRLAPTPSGFLHAGNACNFILNWLAARLQPSAQLLLRIDDLDADRKRPEYVQDVFDTLDWLGLDWDLGPRSPDGFEKNWSQHGRLPAYFALLEELRANGHLFACKKSRRELAPFQGQYPAAFRQQGFDLDAADVAWRIKTPTDAAFPPDFIVRRRDGIPAYQIASLADDLHFGITHIIRGEDLAGSTASQLFLAESLCRPAFSKIQFLHHALLLDEQGAKLSKSAGSAALKTWRQEGQSASRIFQMVTKRLSASLGKVSTAIEFLDFIQNGIIKFNKI